MPGGGLLLQWNTLMEQLAIAFRPDGFCDGITHQGFTPAYALTPQSQTFFAVSFDF
jgi:hypothetical protein